MDFGFSTFLRLFFQAWTQPRQVMKTLLEQRPGYHVWTLVILYAFFQTFEPEYFIPFLSHGALSTLLLVGLLVSVGFDVAAMYFFTGFWLLIGRWLGGKGNLKGLMTAYAWSYPPSIIGIILLQSSNIPTWLRITGGENDFKTIVTAPHMLWQASFHLLSFLLVMWTAVLLVINVSEAHKFSIGRSILTVLLVLVPVMAIVFVGAVFFAFWALKVHSA
ncbi:MAG TPA: YIP1 family protein [bacterium]|nr:YIP1 family protein [bacterium]